MMDRLEQELKLALERKEPSPDFAARVAAAAQRRRPFPDRRWMPAAAALLMMVSGAGAAWRHHEGMLAKERVMTAMKITAVKLNRIQAHVREVRQ
jgi:ferric-dicitrate binding protein FerR (iron transport regulator)